MRFYRRRICIRGWMIRERRIEVVLRFNAGIVAVRVGAWACRWHNMFLWLSGRRLWMRRVSRLMRLQEIGMSWTGTLWACHGMMLI